MGGYASGKRSWAISDRSGLRFPYTEMVREWNGMLVHTSEYEPKQPQLEPKPVGSDPQALWNPRPQPASVASLILLNPNPFTTVKYGGSTFVNVYSVDHQRSTGDTVRLRGPAQVTSAGSGGADATNKQAFRNIPTFDNVSDIDSATGFTITVGQKKSDGSVTTAAGTLTSPENYFFFTSTDTATSGGISGGGDNCSAGPVTLKVVNG
tara:strand:- start:104 stop:727 length:624 start_codon:yes stop_codon:yes gene_type:complete